MEEEKAPWLRQESVIRSFVPHSLTVCPFAAKNTPSGPERRLAPFAWRKLHPAFGGTHGDSVGDGREELCESTLAAIARPAKITVFGARRAPQGTPPPAGIRHSFIRVPFVDGLPVRCKEHPLRCKRSGSTSPIEKDIDGGGKGTLATARIRHSLTGAVMNATTDQQAFFRRAPTIGGTVGDGWEEKAFSPSSHGKVNAVNADRWGGWRIGSGSAIRREGCTAQKPPAGVLNPNPLSAHPPCLV